MTNVLAPPAVFQGIGLNGQVLAAGLLYTYAAGTTTPIATYPTAGSTVPNTNPIVLNSLGETPLWLTPGQAYKFNLTDQFGNQIPGYPVDNIISAGSSAGSSFPPTQAEINSGVVITNPNLPYDNLGRYGIAPNNISAASNNSAILAQLFNPTVNSPTGYFEFPNTTGADIYYCGPQLIELESVVLDLGGCTLNFSGAFTTAMNTYGFFTFIRDVTIQNGTIRVNYNGSGGVNNGAAMRIGSRNGYPFGIYTTGIFDQDNLVANGLPLQGNVKLQNLRISTNNPAAHIVFATGGLRAFDVDNVWLDGGNVVLNNGFYYEYGWSSANGQPSTESAWTSSHMTASRFSNMVITNLAVGGTSQGFGTNGAYGCTFENIYVNTADQGMNFGAGESFFYRTWALDGTTQRMLALKNITVKQCTLGITLGGAGPIAPGQYLYPVMSLLTPPQLYQAQTDFLNYDLDGFSLNTPSGTAIIASGSEIAIRNGACNGGGIALGCECIYPTIENVQIFDAAGPHGIRCDFPTAIWSPRRPIFLAVRNCKITGSTGVGIALGACQSALIHNNQIGANLLYDVTAETVQTNGVNIGITSFGVECNSNFTSTSGTAVAYQNTNNNVNTNNSITNELNLETTGGGGGWLTDFISNTPQSVGTGGTIIIQNLRTVRLISPGATGAIMAAGYAPGHTVMLINESANSITFAASGTSRVASGVGASVPALGKSILIWDTGTSLWY